MGYAPLVTNPFRGAVKAPTERLNPCSFGGLRRDRIRSRPSSANIQQRSSEAGSDGISNRASRDDALGQGDNAELLGFVAQGFLDGFAQEDASLNRP